MKNGLKSLFQRYEFELLIFGFLVVVYKCWGFISALGSASDGLGSVIADATASVRDAAEKASAKVKIKSINPTATDSDISAFERDARTMAGHLGRLPGVWSNWVYPDRKGAFALAKKYSHFMLNGSLPIPIKGTNTYQVRKVGLRLAVLAPFYSDITKGRDLFADLDGAMNLWYDDYQKMYFKLIK